MYPSIEALAADGFGHWLAGFADGEGCFYIALAGPGSYRCDFRVKLRIDDRPVLEDAARRTGLGYVKNTKQPRGQARGQAEWLVIRKADCSRLVEIFTAFPLRAKKAGDFEIWRKAVAARGEVRHLASGADVRRGQGSLRHPNQAVLAALKAELSANRVAGLSP